MICNDLSRTQTFHGLPHFSYTVGSGYEITQRNQLIFYIILSVSNDLNLSLRDRLLFFAAREGESDDFFLGGGRGYYIVAGERRQDQSPLTECNGEDYRKLVAFEGGQWNTKGLWGVSGKLHCDTTKIFVLNPDPPRPHDCNSFQFQRKIWVRDYQNPPGTLLTPAINSNQPPM